MIIMKDAWIFLIALTCVRHLHNQSNRSLFKYCLQPRALNYTFNPPIFPLTFVEEVAMPNIDDQELHLIAS